MTIDPCVVLDEPEIEFRFGQRMVDPRDGLSLFGPRSSDEDSHPKNIAYGVLGTKEGISATQSWFNRLRRPVLTSPNLRTELWPHYPGFEAAFSCSWPSSPSWVHEIDRTELLTLARNLDPNKRAFELVERYLSGIRIAKKRDEDFSLFLCVVPDEIWRNCRSESKVFEGVGFRPSNAEVLLRKHGQGLLFERNDPDEYNLSVDFRRQIKARAMEYRVPIQIIRESTLVTDAETNGHARRLTPLSDRAWNLSTTLFYKAGGKPWRLAGAREGVCYIGIVFRRTDFAQASNTACCAAQMFLDSGDGIVFLGEFGPWYSPKSHDFHLTKEAAKKLLAGVLETYQELDGRQLREIFLHCRSTINKEEFEGYQAACPDGVKLVGVRVRMDHRGLRLYRLGSRPVIRGTFLKLDKQRGYLWASGFKPRLKTYDGWEVPVPLEIDVQHGAASIEQVAKDVFALTKLNYNTCHLGDSQPVTILFSNAVGEVLVSNPTVTTRLPNFKFYI
jgi:hypothetical protein